MARGDDHPSMTRICNRWFGKPSSVQLPRIKFAVLRSAVGIAKLSTEAGKVTPHTLGHTAATWLMQRGADPWKAAGFLGMSVEVLLDTNGHRHPEFLREAATAITTKPTKNIVSGVDPGVDLAAYREKRRKA